MTKSVEILPETLPMNWEPFRKNQECGCVICGKRMKNADPLYVHIGEGGLSILRADLPLGGPSGEAAILSTGIDTGDMGWYAIGNDCAKKLGLAYCKKLQPLDPITAPAPGFQVSE
jgi:hypothetical protein